MSWLRIEGRMPNHTKVALLSDAAFRLHVTASCWCVEERSDGHFKAGIPATLPRAPVGRKLTEAIEELVEAGLWHPTATGFEVHDFLAYNISKVQYAEKAAAGKSGGKRSGLTRRSKPEAPASLSLEQESSTRLICAQADPDPESDLTSQPDPKPDNQRAQGQRPVVRAGLLDSKFQAKAWEIPDEFTAYALDLGLNENQRADAIADFREKITRAGEPPWLASQLCRFLEQKAAKITARGSADSAQPDVLFWDVEKGRMAQ